MEENRLVNIPFTTNLLSITHQERERRNTQIYTNRRPSLPPSHPPSVLTNITVPVPKSRVYRRGHRHCNAQQNQPPSLPVLLLEPLGLLLFPSSRRQRGKRGGEGGGGRAGGEEDDEGDGGLHEQDGEDGRGGSTSNDHHHQGEGVEERNEKDGTAGETVHGRSDF